MQSGAPSAPPCKAAFFLVVDFGDTVDPHIEVRSGTELGLRKVSHAVLGLDDLSVRDGIRRIGIGMHIRHVLGERLAANGEGGTIKHLERTVEELRLDLLDFRLHFVGNARAVCKQFDGASGEMTGPVIRDLGAVGNAVDEILKVRFPVDPGTDKISVVVRECEVCRSHWGRLLLHTRWEHRSCRRAG
mgnify:CR=1 FL=1